MSKLVNTFKMILVSLSLIFLISEISFQSESNNLLLSSNKTTDLDFYRPCSLRIGEKASYFIEIEVDALPFIKGYVAIVEVFSKDAVSIGEKTVFHCVMKAYSMEYLSGFYELHDTFNTWFDCGTLKTIRIEKIVHEGSWKDHVTNYFHSDDGYGIYYNRNTPPEGKRYDMPGNSCDIITMLFLLRKAEKTKPLNIFWVTDVGNKKEMNINFEKGPDLEVDIDSVKETVSTLIDIRAILKSYHPVI